MSRPNLRGPFQKEPLFSTGPQHADSFIPIARKGNDAVRTPPAGSSTVQESTPIPAPDGKPSRHRCGRPGRPACDFCLHSPGAFPGSHLLLDAQRLSQIKDLPQVNRFCARPVSTSQLNRSAVDVRSIQRARNLSPHKQNYISCYILFIL